VSWTPWLELETVRAARDGGAARLELHRPGSRNAWTPKLGDELLVALNACRAEDVRAVLLTGAGRGFSAGYDLGDDSGLTSSELLRRHFIAPIVAVRELDKPVVAAVHGAAAGVGCSLVLASDLALIAKSAFLLLAFVNVGLAPDGGASAFLTARAGSGRAAEMAMLGERIPAERAVEWGLANRVVAEETLTEDADALVRRLAAGPTRAYAAIKHQVNAVAYGNLRVQLELEASLQDELQRSSDHAEGVAAFLGKRAPRFTGD
jgi:2-(1,2-epoxy-1,2-dihydrophenyl)acetyl-CoA isomerase